MKEINVKQVSDNETNSNLEIEENIENAYKKEWVLKTLWIIAIVFWLLYTLIVFAIERPSIEDIRQENLIKAKEYMSWALINKIKYEKIVNIYDTRISQAQWCIDNNSNTWTVNDCFIFNNK